MLDYFYNDHIYLLSTATLLLAIIVAFYFSNFFKDRSQSCEKSQDVHEEHIQDEGHAEHVEDDNCDDNIADGGLLARLKTARLKTLEAELTNDQLEEERKVEREQLTAIFELLKKQESKLNVKEIDESELNAQMSLYR